jgi:hypothetical protein
MVSGTLTISLPGTTRCVRNLIRFAHSSKPGSREDSSPVRKAFRRRIRMNQTLEGQKQAHSSLQKLHIAHTVVATETPSPQQFAQAGRKDRRRSSGAIGHEAQQDTRRCSSLKNVFVSAAPRPSIFASKSKVSIQRSAHQYLPAFHGSDSLPRRPSVPK